MVGVDARRKRLALDRAYFSSIGLNDRGLDPRSRHSERIVPWQDLVEEFGSCKGPINLRKARTIDHTFLKSLSNKVHPGRGGYWSFVSASFARGAIASARGLQVDWATFAFVAQFRGRLARSRGRAYDVKTDASRQGEGEAARNSPDVAREAAQNRVEEVQAELGEPREHEIRPQGMLVSAGQEEERADEPGSGFQSQICMGLTMRNLYRKVLGNRPEPNRMLTQECAEGMAEGSGTNVSSQAAPDLEERGHEPGSGPDCEQRTQSGQVILNEEMQVDVCGQESACLALPQSRDSRFEDIDPLASRIPVQPLETRPEPACKAASPGLMGDSRLLELSRIMFYWGRSARRK